MWFVPRTSSENGSPATRLQEGSQVEDLLASLTGPSHAATLDSVADDGLSRHLWRHFPNQSSAVIDACPTGARPPSTGVGRRDRRRGCGGIHRRPSVHPIRHISYFPSANRIRQWKLPRCNNSLSLVDQAGDHPAYLPLGNSIRATIQSHVFLCPS